MRGHRKQPHTTAVNLTTFIIILFISTTKTPSRFVFVNSEDDLKDSPVDDPQSITDLEEFSEFDSKSDDKLDPGSWRPIFESDEADSDNTNPSLKEYYSNVRELVDGGRAMEEVASEIELMAASGNPHAQSLLGFLYSMGMARERNEAKAFMYHHLAADSGNTRSKLACAYTYYRQQLYEKAVVLYAELAKVAVNSFLISKDYPAIELVRIHKGSEENKDALRKSSGEEDGGFQILKYQAKEYFEKAADNKESGYHYKMDIVYLRGNGANNPFNEAFVGYYIKAADAGHPIAIYQLAKMLHTGIGLRKNLSMATKLYKLVAERGPWSSLSRWALESYLKGEVGKAFLLYSRMAELGYEVAQSNAAWILDKFGEESMCMGESGLCTDAERHQRAHSLWWQASKQGNEQAALLIKDAYYDGQDFNDENTGSDSDTNYLQMKKSYKSSNDVQEFELVPMVCTSYLAEPYKFSSGLINPHVISSKYGSSRFTSSKSDDNVDIVQMCKSPLLWSRDSAVVVPDATEVYWIITPKADITKFVDPLFFSKYVGSASADDTGMWNPSQMLKQCLTWETCIDMTKDLLQISVFPDVICLLKAHILNHVLRDHPNFDDEECIGDIIFFKKGNATIPSLFVCLLTALYLHERQRRLAVAVPPLEPLPEEIIINPF